MALPNWCPRHSRADAITQARADLLDVTAAAQPRADHFLQRDDIGADVAQHGGDSLGPRAPIHPDRPMDVVGDDRRVEAAGDTSVSQSGDAPVARRDRHCRRRVSGVRTSRVRRSTSTAIV